MAQGRDISRATIYIHIRRPLLARGTKAAGLGLNAFLTLSNHCFSAIRLCFNVFKSPRSRVDDHPQIPNSGSIISLKNILFSSLFFKPKQSEKRLPKLPKNNKNRSRNSSQTFSTKSRCWQYFQRGNLDLEVSGVEISIQISMKR